MQLLHTPEWQGVRSAFSAKLIHITKHRGPPNQTVSFWFITSLCLLTNVILTTFIIHLFQAQNIPFSGNPFLLYRFLRNCKHFSSSVVDAVYKLHGLHETTLVWLGIYVSINWYTANGIHPYTKGLTLLLYKNPAVMSSGDAGYEWVLEQLMRTIIDTL